MSNSLVLMSSTSDFYAPFLRRFGALILLLIFVWGCQNTPNDNKPEPTSSADSIAANARQDTATIILADSITNDAKPVPVVDSAAGSREKPDSEPGTPSTTTSNIERFSDIKALDPTIALDIRYASANNFTKSQIYDCPACLLRPEAARAVLRVQGILRKKNLGLKIFDCYRPKLYQERLWEKVPNATYVTPPGKGSMHSRGAAVDLTIIDEHGRELDMGTGYDYFGVEAHTDYTKLSAKVLENRKLLRRTMEAAGFKGIRTEWWHFSFQGKMYPFSDYLWKCG